MANEEAENQAPPSKKIPWLMVIIVSLLFVILLGGTIGATLYFSGALSAKHATAEESDTASNSESEGEDSKKAGPTIYIKLDPAFVVNFEGQGRVKFLQITVELMTRDPKVQTLIENHMPVIRNNLVLLFSSQSYESVSTLEGKESLREQALAEVQKILEAESGDAGVEAVYFTSFVMQ